MCALRVPCLLRESGKDGFVERGQGCLGIAKIRSFGERKKRLGEKDVLKVVIFWFFEQTDEKIVLHLHNIRAKGLSGLLHAGARAEPCE